MQPPLRRLLLYSNCALRHTAADSHVHRSMVQRGLATASTSHMESIKSLRERSGAPIGEVKAALVEADWEPGSTQISRGNIGLKQKHRPLLSSASLASKQLASRYKSIVLTMQKRLFSI